MELLAKTLDIMRHWVSQVFVIIFLSLCLDFVQKKIVNRVIARLHKTNTFWDHIIFEALQTPLTFLIWIVGIAFAAQVIEKQTNTPLFSTITLLRNVGVIIMVAWFFIRWVKGAEKNLVAAGKGDKTTIDAIGKILRFSIFITAGLVILQTFGLSVSGVMAFGGIGGLAIGFAAKDMLANFFGAFMLYWDRPFKVGDWIRSPDREIEGTVESIGWRLTLIRTFDKRPLYVPNSAFSSIAVENPSRMTHRRIYETIGLRHRDAAQVPTVLADVREMLLNHPEIDQNETLMVNINTFGASSIEFFIYTFTRTTVWTKFHEVKEDVLLKIREIVASHGAEIAIPETSIHLPMQEATPFQSEKVSAWRANPAKSG